MSRRPDRPRRFYTGILLLGAATGLRSQIAFATVCSQVPDRSLPRVLRHRPIRRVAVALAAGELVADKLPSAPDRTQAAGLLARLSLGGATGGIAARSMGYANRRAVLVGTAAAGAAAFTGLAGRRKLVARFPSLEAGLVEDGVALLFSLAGTRLVRS